MTEQERLDAVADAIREDLTLTVGCGCCAFVRFDEGCKDIAKAAIPVADATRPVTDAMVDIMYDRRWSHPDKYELVYASADEVKALIREDLEAALKVTQ